MSSNYPDNAEPSSSTEPAPCARKSNKPIMEKRRRARINSSLQELKSLLADFMTQEGPRHCKMEKADILEMTVKYVRQLKERQLTSNTRDPEAARKYTAGYQECVNEISKYLATTTDVDHDARQRMLQYISSSSRHFCIKNNVCNIDQNLCPNYPKANSHNGPILQNLTESANPVRQNMRNIPSAAAGSSIMLSSSGSSSLCLSPGDTPTAGGDLAQAPSSHLTSASDSVSSMGQPAHANTSANTDGPTTRVHQAPMQSIILPQTCGQVAILQMMPGQVLQGTPANLQQYVIPIVTSPSKQYSSNSDGNNNFTANGMVFSRGQIPMPSMSVAVGFSNQMDMRSTCDNSVARVNQPISNVIFQQPPIPLPQHNPAPNNNANVNNGDEADDVWRPW